MTKILIASHLALFLSSVLVMWKARTRIICCLAIPPGLGFLYTSVFQAWTSLHQLAPDLTAGDVITGLWVSLISYLALLTGYWLVQPSPNTSWLKDAELNTDRINRIGLVFFVVGVFGHWIFMRQVGGFSAYLGSSDWTEDVNPYEMSAYVYNLRYGILGAVAMWFLSGTLGRLPSLYFLLFIPSMGFLLFLGILDTSRGETLRAVLLIIGYLYFASDQWSNTGRFLARVLMVALAIGAVMASFMLPSFRDQGRKITASETTWGEALVYAKSGNRAESGGEFDSGVRIVKRINSGDIHSPGPVHIARFLWNVVPRSLVPEKHEMFERWAGKDYMEIRIGSTAYYGCAPSGWGEAYGCMGWLGAILYWALFGVILKKVEKGVGSSMAAILIGASFYLPLMQYVGIDFWVGSMSLCTSALPILLVLIWFCRQPAPRRMKRQITTAKANI